MQEPKSRVIQTERLTITLISGATLEIRPLTLSEREHCFSFVPKGDVTQAVDAGAQYLRIQGDLLYYIVTRLSPAFKREDIDTQFDTIMMKRIFGYIFNDPFEDMGS